MDDPSPNFCNLCGRRLSPADRFCPQCGAVLQPEIPQPPPQAAAPAPLPPPPMKKKSVVGPLLAVIVIVVVVAASFTYFLGDEFGFTTPFGETYTVGEGNQIYVFDYENTECWLYTNVTYSDYTAYQSTAIDRRLTTAYDYSLCASYVTSDDPIVEDIAANLLKIADHLNLDDVGTINLALAFTQSITYRYDNDSAGPEDYWRFPVETLWIRCGDCEDKSFLFASLIEEMGFDAVCLVFDDHLAVGVACPDAHGTYYDKWGSQYYYCETTAIGWTIGEIPDNYGSANLVQVE